MEVASEHSSLAGLAKPVRVLGEDLVLFRDGEGKFGLLDSRCCHRGTSLYYGRVEPEGIRCCYHGWLFDVTGRCVDQPCEPPESTYKERVRQPWYPCREYKGLVFAYMGPPDRRPAFPRFDILEQGEGVVVADGTSYGLGGGEILDCNWLQIFENVMDPFHVFVLHNAFSGQQFTKALAVRPRVSWEATRRGMRSIQDRDMTEGKGSVSDESDLSLGAVLWPEGPLRRHSPPRTSSWRWGRGSLSRDRGPSSRSSRSRSTRRRWGETTERRFPCSETRRRRSRPSNRGFRRESREKPSGSVCAPKRRSPRTRNRSRRS